jgi:hypothetical protein
MGKQWWGYINIYIYMVDVCSHRGKMCTPGGRGAKLRTGTKYSLGVIEWQRKLVHPILPIGPHSYINTCSLPPGILFSYDPEDATNK